MGVFDKAKGVFNKFVDVTDDDYDDDYNEDYGEQDAAYEEPKPAAKPRRYDRAETADRRDNVVRFQQNGGNAPANGAANGAANGRQRAFGDSQVVVKKVKSVNEVGAIIDILKQRRIVFLNLEDAPADAIQRIIDVIYGATYALEGTFRAIAERAFVLTPHNISVSGEDYSEFGEQAD